MENSTSYCTSRSEPRAGLQTPFIATIDLGETSKAVPEVVFQGLVHDLDQDHLQVVDCGNLGSDEDPVSNTSCSSAATLCAEDTLHSTRHPSVNLAKDEQPGVPWLGDGYAAADILAGTLCIPQSEILLGHPLFTDGTQSIIWLVSIPKAFGRTVLVAKLALSDDDVPDLFQEAIFLRAAAHPGLVEMKGIVVADQDRSFQGFVMEYVEGEDLFTLNNRFPSTSHRLPRLTCLQIISQLAQVLLHLHDCGITHHDIKLENVLVSGNLTGTGAPPTVKLLDLGMSLTHAETKRLKGLRGSLPYIAPELLQAALDTQESCGAVSSAVDVWGFGVLCWEISTGCSAYKGKTRWEVLQGVASGSLQLDLAACNDERIASLVKGCMTRDVSERIGLDEVLDAVTAWCNAPLED